MFEIFVVFTAALSTENWNFTSPVRNEGNVMVLLLLETSPMIIQKVTVLNVVGIRVEDSAVDLGRQY